MIKLSLTIVLSAFAAMSSGAFAQVSPETPTHKGTPARPADSTANLPSTTGAQTTIPGGAVTGAGHAQGPAQIDGEPGEGLQGRAAAENKEIVEQKRAREAPAGGESTPIGATNSKGAEGSAGVSRPSH